MTVAKRDFVEAIGVARRRATLRGAQRGLAKQVVLSAGPGGLSVRSSNSAFGYTRQERLGIPGACRRPNPEALST
jgi:hypothetical protein